MTKAVHGHKVFQQLKKDRGVKLKVGSQLSCGIVLVGWDAKAPFEFMVSFFISKVVKKREDFRG